MSLGWDQDTGSLPLSLACQISLVDLKTYKLTYDQTCTPSLPSFPGTIKWTVSIERRMMHSFDRALSDLTISVGQLSSRGVKRRVAYYVVSRHWQLLSEIALRHERWFRSIRGIDQ